MSVAVSSPLPSPSFDGLAVAAEERYIGSVLSDNEQSGDNSPRSPDDYSVSLFSSSSDMATSAPPPPAAVAISATASSILATLRGVNGGTSSFSAAISRPHSPHSASTDSDHSASSALSSYPAWLRAQNEGQFNVEGSCEARSMPLQRASSSSSLQRALSPPTYSPTASTASPYSHSPASANSAFLRPSTRSPPTAMDYLSARLEQLQAGERHQSSTLAKQQQWSVERVQLKSIGSVPDLLQMAAADGLLSTRSQSGVHDRTLSRSPTSPRYARTPAYDPPPSQQHDVPSGQSDSHRRSRPQTEHRLRSSSATFKPHHQHTHSYLPNGSRRTSIHDELPPARFSPSTASTVSSSGSNSPHSASSMSDEPRHRGASSATSQHFSPLSSPSLFSQQFAALPLSAIVSRGLLVDLCTDQYGSRFIQQKLEVCTDDERDLAFHAITAANGCVAAEGSALVVSLSLDVFANYTVQKLMEVCAPAQQRALCLALAGSVLLLSLQTYGCRVVQKAVEVARVDVQAALVAEIEGHAMALMTDQNGNHVVQKCIECCPAALLDPLLQSVRSHIYRLASHPYGCRVTQRMLEHGSASQRQLIMDEIVSADGSYALLDLMRSSFGNYVAQGTLTHGSAWHRHRLCEAVRGHVAALSRHKFASNVMEKCLLHADAADQQSLIDEIMGDQHSAAPSLSLPFLDLCSDPYGNYVLQRLLNVIEEGQRVDLLWRLKRFVPHLKKIPYGKHILARIERMSFAQISQAAAQTGGADRHFGGGAAGGVTEVTDGGDGGDGSWSGEKAHSLSHHAGRRTTPQYPPGFHHFPQHSHSPTRGGVSGAGRPYHNSSPVQQSWDGAWAHSHQQHVDYGEHTRFVPFNR